jgi:alpha-tubulin suppressor-like RCC1 family protein
LSVSLTAPTGSSVAAPHARGASRIALGVIAAMPLLLAACGGGGGGGSSATTTPTTPTTPTPAAPTITTQPAAVSVRAGETASFSVVATGTGTLGYQWYRGSAAISGATAASYTTAALTEADNGAAFSVVVSNAGVSTTSASATLTVTAAPTSALPRVMRLAVSERGYALGVRADGSVVAWGGGMEGGTGTAIAGTTAKLVSGVGNIAAAGTNDFTSGGGNRSLVITREGTVWGWGRNWKGSLGIAYAGDDNLIVSTPVQVSQLGAVVQTAACLTGSNVSYALRADGSVWLLPGERSGSTGAGTATQITGLPAIGQLVLADSTGGDCSLLALARDGGVWRTISRESVYDNVLRRYTMLNTVEQDTVAPPNVAQLSCQTVAPDPNGAHCLAVTGDGRLWAWGANYSGQLGLGDQVSRTLATEVPGVSNIKKVFAVLGRSFVLTTAGRVYVWGGYNGDEMSGGRVESAYQDHWKPGLVPGIQDIDDVAIAPYGRFVTTLKTDGTVWSWGDNTNGVFANGTSGDFSTVPVQAVGLSLN